MSLGIGEGGWGGGGAFLLYSSVTWNRSPFESVFVLRVLGLKVDLACLVSRVLLQVRSLHSWEISLSFRFWVSTITG